MDANDQGQGSPAAPEPNERPKIDPTRWLIWSREHTAYWRAERMGYTVSVDEAGRYTTPEALALVREGEPGRQLMLLAPESGAPLIAMIERPAEFMVVRRPPAPSPARDAGEALRHIARGRTPDQWLSDLRRMVECAEADPQSIGVLSMGERCAVALVLGVEHLPEPDGEGGKIPTRPRGYTWLDCLDRIEDELFLACIKLQRERA